MAINTNAYYKTNTVPFRTGHYSPSWGIVLFVEGDDADPFQINIELSATITQLKQTIAKYQNYDVNLQNMRLYHQNYILEDDRVISEYKIRSYTKLKLVICDDYKMFSNVILAQILYRCSLYSLYNT